MILGHSEHVLPLRWGQLGFEGQLAFLLRMKSDQLSPLPALPAPHFRKHDSELSLKNSRAAENIYKKNILPNTSFFGTTRP